MSKIWASAMLLEMVLLAKPMAAWAQSAGNAPPAPAAPALTIGVGDLVDVVIYDSPELSGRFRVNEKGEVEMPLLGSVHVDGLTAEQAAKLIQDRYVAAEILQPESTRATVFIEEYASQGITITGEVKNAGVYPALGVRMLNDVLTAAGGVLPTASAKVIVTHRSAPQHAETVEYNPAALKPVIPAVQVFPGDTIMVPRAGVVYVAGNVVKPGAYLLDGREPLTALEAVTLAGGTSQAPALRRVQLVRKLEGGRKEMMIVPLSRIYKGKAPDVALVDGDILYVPTSTGKLAAERAITSMVSIGTSVGVYRASYQQ